MNKDYPRVLTVQDISCFGQCSLTVALPIISACGAETCVLPSAVLSTHTCGFSGYTFRDLTSDMPLIERHWQKENISFDAVYTGYLGSAEQIGYVLDIAKNCLNDGGLLIVDPAMADNGKLYPGFDAAFVEEMKKLAAKADFLLPNLTEACLLTGAEYKTEYDENYIKSVAEKLCSLGAKTVVLTGVGYKEEKTGVVIASADEYYYYEHEKLSDGCHGTGDIYASAFTGALVRGINARKAAEIAANYVLCCIKATAGDPSHKYGAKFEKALFNLISAVQKEAE